MAVYFIQRDSDKAIKIGKSINVKSRLYHLQRNEPSRLHLMGVVDGYTREEIRLHKQFAKFRLEGEWFKAEPDLTEFVSRHATFVDVVIKPPVRRMTPKKVTKRIPRTRFALRELMAKKERVTGKRCTYEVISEVTGINLNTLSSIANNKIKRIPVDGLKELLNFFDCQPNDFIIHAKDHN